ncbi:MAG TPA: hypothetical protein VI248_25820 [Kineosporiaceae bacterium]
MTDRTLPPGWPEQVRRPGTPDWERSATGWLLDQCPPEYRGYAVVVRHPGVLAWLAGCHVEAGLAGAGQALARARGELAHQVPPPALAELIEVLEAERVRLVAARRAVGLVEGALRGERYVPRL